MITLAAYLLKESIIKGKHMKTKIFFTLFLVGFLSSNLLLGSTFNDLQNIKGDTHSLNVFPNPVKELGTLQFDLESPSVVTIEFYDLSGRKVKEIKMSDLEIGEQNISFETNELNDGVYICKVTTNLWSKGKRIIIKR